MSQTALFPAARSQHIAWFAKAIRRIVIFQFSLNDGCSSLRLVKDGTLCRALCA